MSSDIDQALERVKQYYDSIEELFSEALNNSSKENCPVCNTLSESDIAIHGPGIGGIHYIDCGHLVIKDSNSRERFKSEKLMMVYNEVYTFIEEQLVEKIGKSCYISFTNDNSSNTYYVDPKLYNGYSKGEVIRFLNDKLRKDELYLKATAKDNISYSVEFDD